jgi:hypothetical protein
MHCLVFRKRWKNISDQIERVNSTNKSVQIYLKLVDPALVFMALYHRAQLTHEEPHQTVELFFLFGRANGLNARPNSETHFFVCYFVRPLTNECRFGRCVLFLCSWRVNKRNNYDAPIIFQRKRKSRV